MKHIFTFFSVFFLSSIASAQCNLAYTIDSIPANCAGACDGGITFTYANSGTNAAPYVAVLQNSLGANVDSWTFFNESGAYTFQNICAGSYTLSIQSVFTPACVYNTSIVVTEPTPLVISSIDLVHETSGLSNGEITINASGGILPYQYSIDNGANFQASNQFTGLDAGPYFTVVQDANGCTLAEAVGLGLIVTSGCEVVAAATPQATSCAGTCDGQIVYEYENLQMISGAPYTVTLEDSDGNTLDVQIHATQTQTIVFDNLCADTYTITLQGSSCSFIITGTVLSPDAMTLYVNSDDPAFGLSDGTAELVVIGGVAGYQYSVDGGVTFQPSANFSGLAEGTYLGIVQDANGCLQQQDFTLTDNTPCNLSISASALAAPSCFEACDASISYSYSESNGHEAYSISLFKNEVLIQVASHNSASGNGTFTNLCAGVYDVQLTDGLGCTNTASVTIAQPLPLLISGVTTTASAGNADDGTATINISGGQAPFSYSINDIDYFGSNVFNDLAPGVYVAYVEDVMGCTHNFTFVIQNNLSCNFGITVTTNAASCAGMCDGEIDYSFNGTGSDTPFSIVLEGGGNVIETSVSPSPNVVGNFSGLCPGTYLLTVGNSTGCEQMAAAFIQEPTSISVEAITETASTGNSDGTITVIASGGTAPYEYSIDNQTSWQSTASFTNLAGGGYTAWVKDANGCFGFYSVELEDTSSCAFIMNIETTSTTCANYCNGTLTCLFLDVNDNPPLSIQLFQGTTLVDTSETFNDFAGLHQFTDLCAGAYRVEVMDADGCVDAQEIYIHGPDPIQVLDTDVTDATVGNSDGAAEITITGGTAPYEFTIDNAVTWQNENLFNDLDSGFYIMMIEDANDCFFIHCFVVNEQPGCNITTTFALTSPMSCYDSCDAVIQYSYFEAVNTPPYTVELITNSGVIETTTYSTNNFTGIWDTLCQGIFTMSVTNGNGCMAFMPWLTITLPQDLFLDGVITDASMGLSNGSIELYTTGGSGQHLYSLDAFSYQPSGYFENFAPGTYLAYVMDENDCTDTLNFEIFENAACDISVTTLADAMVPCPGDCSGSISFDYNDANANPPYSIVLSTSSGAVIGSSVSTNTNGVGLFTNLCAGDYAVTVTDASGCQSASSLASIAQPDYFQMDIDAVQPTDGYYNGSFTLTPTGGTPPYQYSTNNQVTWSGINSWSNLAAGFYIIYVKDANGCVQVVCYVLSEPGVASVVELSAHISVYPNPTQGMVFVDAENIQTVSVYDMNGKQIELSVLVAMNGTALDFSNAASGVYILEITTIGGEVVRTQVVKN